MIRAIRKFFGTGLLVFGLLAGGLALTSAPAMAAYVFSKTIGGPCTGAGGACEPGQLKEPAAIALNEETGNIYVVDRGGNSVKEFDSTGAPIDEFDGAAAGHALAAPEGIAIDNSGSAQDPSNEDVYVADPVQGVVDKFSPSGAYLGQLTEEGARPFNELHGVAVDAAGTVWVYHKGAGLQVMEAYSDGVSNEFLSSRFKPVGFGSSQQFAVDSEDNLYVGSSEHNFVKKNLVMKTDKAGDDLITELDGEPSTGVAVNVANDVFLDNIDTVAEFDPTGALLERFGSGHLTAGAGVAVNSGENLVYATDSSADAVVVFAGPPSPLRARSGEATNLQHDGGATLEGTVDPKGVPVISCEFEYAAGEEYASTKTYSHTVPCSSPHPVSEADPLTGSAPIAVSAQVSGLPIRPGRMSVHYRLKATDPVVGYGADKAYITVPFTAPVIGAAPASDVSQFAAQLNATVETDQALIDYRFEYGTTTAYGQVAPIPNGYTPIAAGTQTISQPVSGLQAGTTYHYRVVAGGVAGSEIPGPDETFTTLAVPAATASTGAASGVGVGEATLTGTIDPHGWDTTYLFEYGPTTAYGRNWPTVPVDMGALEGPQPVVVTVPSLLPGTTYHYRLIAVNAAGTSYGQDMTFTTGQYPAPIIQEPVTLRTLLVPSEVGKVVTTATKKKRKKSGQRAKHKARKRRKAGTRPHGRHSRAP